MTGTGGIQVSVLVPCYNERQTVEAVISGVTEHLAEHRFEVIVVDDGSDDGSTQLLQEIAETGSIRLIHHERRRGKGASLRDAIAQASGEIVVVQDADLEYDPSDLPSLIDPILNGSADVVYGSRFSGLDASTGIWRLHRLGNQFLTWLSNWFTGLDLTDMETGYKAIRRNLLEGLDLQRDAFGIEPEITAKLAKLGAKFLEVPITYQGRSYSDGKKIKWRDGVSAVHNIIRNR